MEKNSFFLFPISLFLFLLLLFIISYFSSFFYFYFSFFLFCVITSTTYGNYNLALFFFKIRYFRHQISNVSCEFFNRCLYTLLRRCSWFQKLSECLFYSCFVLRRYLHEFWKLLIGIGTYFWSFFEIFSLEIIVLVLPWILMVIYIIDFSISGR